jgi:hypothetical protein
MTRHAAVFLAATLLIVSGCATNTHSSTPVALTITSDTANGNFVKQVRDTTLDAIAQQVPNARPMTINVKLDVTARSQATPNMATTVSQPVNQTRPVATLSTEPWSDPAPATVPVNNSVFGTDITQQITAYRVVYTISDAAGKIVESNELTLDQGRLFDAAGAPVKVHDGLVGTTATFLASRVKTLNQ